MDVYTITPQERARFEQQFLSLKPIDGIVTGDQAKGFLLQSQLPPATLGIIWALADTDADGKMNINEFSIACKLINLKLRGFDIPKALPPSLSCVVAQPPVLQTVAKPPVPPLPSMPLIPGLNTGPAKPSPPSGGPSPILSGPPPIPPLPASHMIRPTAPVIPPLPQPVQIPRLSQDPIVPLMSQPIVTQPLPSQIPVIPINQTPMPVTPMHPMQPTPIPPNTLTGLTTTQPSPPSQPTPPTPPIAIQTLERKSSDAGAVASPLVEWAVPQASKLKYTQLFNTTDKTRSGFLTGPQARNILLASKLPQPILAQIWGLSDMDADGRLACDEFVLALHLCEMARSGETLPTTLPPNLVPPTMRRIRNNSLTLTPSGEMADPTAGMNQVTFEDKRKENFEKGQAELDRRRKALMDIQRKEQEERERKEKAEREKLEKIRLEQERQRQEEFERQVEKQKEAEKLRDEERKRAEEQREAARKEMERQRQAEWENQRIQELETKRQKQQEAVLALKAKSQALTIELSQKEDKVKELSKQISDTRCGVTSVKSVIDGMRATRDQNLAEYNRLKALVKQRNQQLVTLSQQKAKLEAQGRYGEKDSDDDVLAFNNKTILVKNLKDKVVDLEAQVKSKSEDVENNNAQLQTLRAELVEILSECEKVYDVYADKRNKMLDLKGSNKLDNAWGQGSAWEPVPDQNWGQEVDDKAGFTKYRALYEFVSRNGDELSFQPGDIIYVPNDQQGEPGWLSGELRGATGWFPESYVERADQPSSLSDSMTGQIPKTPLEGIAEVSETISDTSSAPEEGPPLPIGGDPILGLGRPCDMIATAIYSFTAKKSSQLSFIKGDTFEVSELQDQWCYGQLNINEGWFPKSYVRLDENFKPATNDIPPVETTSSGEYYVALYTYTSEEPGDLNFEQGETIQVVGKDGDWWTGVVGARSGIFPSNYVAAPQEEIIKEPEVISVTPVALATTPQPESTSVTPDLRKSPIADKLTPTEAQCISERAATPDFASLTSQMESGGEDSDSKKSKKPVIATVIAPYQATSTEQLSLQRGQLVMIRKKTSSGWWEGELQAKGKKRQIGWFPASYVKLLAGGSRAQSRKTSESGLNDGLLERVIALYPYTARNEDELSFEKDDIVTVLAKDEPAWWKGECKGAVGLFPSNYVGQAFEDINNSFDTSNGSFTSNGYIQEKSPSIKIKISKEEKKRQQHIKELILTEQAYIDDMSIVHEVFEKPLIESGILKKDELHSIFINWHDIIECNYTFLRSLRVRRDMSKGGVIRTVGDVLCENLPRMTVYVRFCSCQLRAAATLQHLSETNQAFCNLNKKCQQDPRTQGFPLSSFLIKPMQRITKYPLLVSKILEYTPKGHPDRNNLEEALAKAEELCLQINEGVREIENCERLEWLQGHLIYDGLQEPLVFNSLTNALGPRKYLHHGVLTKVKSGKELVGFLMNDFLLLAQPNKSLNGQFSFEKNRNVLFRLYKKPLLLSETIIHEGGPDIKLEHSRVMYNLSAQNETDRNLWMRKFTQAQSEMRRMETDKLRRQQSMNREVFCEVSMGSQENRTQPVNLTTLTDVTWNASMQFLVKDLKEDVLCLTVKEKGNFSPDQFLGRTELRVSEIIDNSKTTPGPTIKEIRLREVRSGIIKIKLDLHFFDRSIN